MIYRPTNGPIAREALPFALIMAAVTVVVGFFLPWFSFIPAILFLYVLLFFRNPTRAPLAPLTPADVIAGADGKIVAAGIVPRADFPGGQALRIATFMSLFDVHVNWSPISGTVAGERHVLGKFLNAMDDKCAEENERKHLLLTEQSGHTCEVILVAGLVARRIVCPLAQGDPVTRGNKIGLIRFGSRVEIFLPANSELLVSVGQRARGGETLIARLPGQAG